MIYLLEYNQQINDDVILKLKKTFIDTQQATQRIKYELVKISPVFSVLYIKNILKLPIMHNKH